MKESIRAARDEIAHNRSVAALKALAGEDNEKIKELEDLRVRRVPEPVGSTLQREIMADILEDLVRNASFFPEPEPSASSITFDFLTTEQRETLVSAGYETDEAICGAPMGDIEALDGIGPATIEKIQQACGGPA